MIGAREWNRIPLVSGREKVADSSFSCKGSGIQISILTLPMNLWWAGRRLCLCGFKRDEAALEVHTQWLRNITSPAALLQQFLE